MRIGMILITDGGFPPDIRVEKEAKALVNAGHELFVLTVKASEVCPSEEYIPSLGITVCREKKPDISLPLKAVYTFLMFEPAWNVLIKKFIKKYHINILHVHDLHMLPTALKAANNEIPVIADLHENMPAAALAYRANDARWKRVIKALLRNYKWMQFNEARSLRKCIRTIVVVPEAAERIYGYGINPERVIVVSNTEDETTFNFNQESADSSIVNKYKDYWVASYIGGIGPHRGVDTVLASIPSLSGKIKNLKLLIVGVQSNLQKNKIEQTCSELKITDSVEIIGWQSFEKVNSYIMSSNVCLVPHNNFEHTQTTVPHKLFQYMICQKPVLVSDCAPLKRIVKETNAGIVFEANNSEDCAAKLIWLHDNPDKADEMGDNGRKAALGEYRWEYDAARLTDIYNNLC